MIATEINIYQKMLSLYTILRTGKFELGEGGVC